MTRLYVLVRRDLSRSQQAVQAGHAVAEWCSNEASRWHWDGRDITTPKWRWRNHVLVYLGVRDERELLVWYEKLRIPGALLKAETGAIAWREPDWGNQLTAIAVLGEREDFEGLTLL